MRESLNANFLNIKSPPIVNNNITMNTPQMTSANLPVFNAPASDVQDFCGIKSPIHTLNINSNEALR